MKETKQKGDWDDHEASFKKDYEQNTQVITGFISGEMGGYRHKDTANFRVLYTSADAGSSYFEVKSTIIVANIFEKSISNFRYCGQFTLFPYKSTISKDAWRIIPFGMPGASSFDLLYMWVRGRYKKIDASKTFIIDDVYCYNMRGRTCNLATGNTRKDVIKCAMTFGK